MKKLPKSLLALCLFAASSGCCADPYRFLQNAYFWNNPVPDYYRPGPPPPVTTPPGPTVPAVPELDAEISSQLL